MKNFNLNKNPIITEDIYKVLIKNEAFNVENLEIGKTLGFKNFFFDITHKMENIGFLFFKPTGDGLEILIGKYDSAKNIKGFIDYVLENIDAMSSQCDLKDLQYKTYISDIQVTNPAFDYILSKSYHYGFKSRWNETEKTMKNIANKMLEDPELGNAITLVRPFS